MKIALFNTKMYDKQFFDIAIANTDHTIEYFEVSLNSATAKLTPGYDAVCVFVNDYLQADTLEQLAKHGIRLILLRCAGFNNVDIEKAHTLGIRIYRVPAYSPQAVAEHAVALLLTLNRKTHKAFNRVREHNFSLERLTGFDVYKKTIGIVGTGQIGIAFSKIMKGFGCNVLAYDIVQSQEALSQGVQYVDFDTLLAQSDIISLHCPLNHATKHMLNMTQFEKMKQGVMIINTSRGGLIHTIDAIQALKTGKIGYLGIDVYEQEEHLFFKDLSESIVADDVIARLMTFPNVLITAHQGFFTNEALEQIAQTTIQNIDLYISNTHTENEVI
ncbi:MAG: D-lactate dehydrogenase [Bacteroidetes bacterium ADurb.Bin217]|nr:MAG: D-lactate dehydrogenase [Bacteroidetes bacterium ADurb.Bin217]